MSKKRVIINGAQGKMGRLAVIALSQQTEFEVVGQLGRSDDLVESILSLKPEIVVDLTSAESVYANTLSIIQHHVHPVIGTTGLLPEQILELTSLCERDQLGGLIVPNFSIAAVLMMHFAQIAARYMPNVEIIEAHHPHKKEAPSGTAIKTAQLIAKARSEHPSYPCHELLSGARGANCQDIPIHALRLPGVVADQEVLFGQVGETLSLQHRTIDRVCFMPGLILACQQVTSLKTLCYGLEHLLNF